MSQSFKTSFLLFRSNFYISAFTFGGGYVVIPMMRKYFVEDHALITEDQLLSMAAISQSTPGAIAVNLAVLVGYEIEGKRGAFISCLATILPPLLILGVISNFYDLFRSNTIINALLIGMEAGVAATIIDTLMDMGALIFNTNNQLIKSFAPITFILVFFFQINILMILFFCALLSFAQAYLKQKGVLR